MGRGEARSGGASTKPKDRAQLPQPLRRQVYGTTTSLPTRTAGVLSGDVSLNHFPASEDGLSYQRTGTTVKSIAREWGIGDVGERILIGAVVITFFAASVFTLFFSGLASSGAVGRAAPPIVAEKLDHHVALISEKRRLTIRATNDYGEFDRKSLELYGLEMVVEPFRESTLKVELPEDSGLSGRYFWRLQEADASGITSKSADDVWTFQGGPEAKIVLEWPGTLLVLTVKHLNDQGVVLAEGRVKVSCKYVRREIRDLTVEDREDFLDTMQTFYTISPEEGKAKFGMGFDNYQHITAYHNAKIVDYCYHDGIQFLTSHAAFDLWLERYLQMINPKVCLPMWDFMIEASSLGNEWYNSVIFDDDWFGSALGSPENSFMVSEGRFGNISTLFDPKKNILRDTMRSNHNAYGYVTSIRNYQDLPRLTRTTSYCGLISNATFATFETFVGCFEQEDSLYGWETCLETKVHGDLHGLLGGGFNCNTDMNEFAENHPEYSVRLLSFVLEYMTFNYWPMNAFIPSANTCDTECTPGQTEPCGCTCNIDAFAITDQETYDYCESFMENAIDKFTGDEFITYDADAKYPYGFLKDDERMSDEEALLLMRYMVKIGCEPGAVGAMSTGASPIDPIFWTLHALFEKALHILWLSPQYKDKYDLEWVDGTCSGSAYTDELPFTERIMGIGPGTKLLTNAELLSMMHPSNVALPYIYEGFNRWGGNPTTLL